MVPSARLVVVVVVVGRGQRRGIEGRLTELRGLHSEAQTPDQATTPS